LILPADSVKASTYWPRYWKL